MIVSLHHLLHKGSISLPPQQRSAASGRILQRKGGHQHCTTPNLVTSQSTWRAYIAALNLMYIAITTPTVGGVGEQPKIIHG